MSSDPLSSPWDNPELSDRRAVDQLCRAFEDQWRMGESPSIESVISSAPQHLRSALLPELIAVEWEWRARSGNLPTQEEYRSRFPEHEALLNQLITDGEAISRSCSETPQPVSLKTGDEFAGYRILRELGSGGMGTVFLAEIASISHPVALKILQPSHEQADSMAARFEREARLLSRLDHPGIVPLYSYGEEDGRRYLVMKAIQGVSLAEVVFGDEPAGNVADVLRNRKASGRWDQIKSIAIQLAETLQFVHQAGILHRDIKPSNILLMDSGKAFLSDFGLARADLIDSDLTSQHEFIGTLRYAAPESLDGVWTVQTDLYSLGLVLLELYNLEASFGARTRRELLHQKLDARSLQKSIAAGSIPAPLRRIIEKLTTFNPEQRYKSAAVALADLKKMEFAEPSRASSQYLRFVALIGFALALTGLAAFWNHRNKAQTESNSSDISEVSSTDPSGKLKTPAEMTAVEAAIAVRISEKHVVPLSLRDRANLLTISDSGDNVLLSEGGQLLRWDTNGSSAYDIHSRPNGRVILADISSDGDVVICFEESNTDEPGNEAAQHKSFDIVSNSPEEGLLWTGFRIPGYDASICVPVFVRGGPATQRGIVLIPGSPQPAIHNVATHQTTFLALKERHVKMAAAWGKWLAVVTSDNAWMLSALEAPDSFSPAYPTEVTNPSSLHFVNDGQYMLVSNEDEFSLFSVATKQKLTTQKIPAGTRQVLSTPHQGSWIAFSGMRAVHVFDISLNQWLPEAIETTDNIRLAATIVEEQLVLTVEESGQIRLSMIQPSGIRLIDELKSPPLSLAAYSVRSRRLAAIDDSANLRIFHIEP